jgi:hypothetical protein
MIESSKRVFPRFLESLAANVLPIYSQLANAGHDFGNILWRPNAFELLSDEPALESALFEWAHEFNAEEDWLIMGAFRTLRDWHIAPDWRASYKWNTFCSHDDVPVVGPDFEFRSGRWDVQLRSWPDYSLALRKKFEKTLLEYELNVRELAKAAGLVRTRRKYSPDNLDWFVLYQLAGISSTKIASQWSQRGTNVDDSTVLKGIKAAEMLLQWKSLRRPNTKPNRKIR